MSDLFQIESGSLTSYQACRRRFLLELDYRPTKWRSKVLFDACLRRAILLLSRGGKVDELIADARARFMMTAANPGLELMGVSPYVVAKDHCAMLSTILTALTRISILRVREPEPQQVGSVEWYPRSWVDDSGALHRWLTVDHWGEDDLSRECHSWRTIGDMAAMSVPLTLHVIEIGQLREGRRHSAWARAWKDPLIKRHYRFKRRDGGRKARMEFQGWKPWWLSEHFQETDAEVWVERMWQEGAAQELMHEVNVKLPDDATLGHVREEIAREGSGMELVAMRRENEAWRRYSMSRGACDGMVPCPFQNACYGEYVEKLESTGLYVRRKQDTVGAAGRTKEAKGETVCSSA